MRKTGGSGGAGMTFVPSPVAVPAGGGLGGAAWQDQNASTATGAFGSGFLRRTVLTGLLMVYSQLVLVLWFVLKERRGSVLAFYEQDVRRDWRRALLSGYLHPSAISARAWGFIAGMFGTALFLMRAIPGPAHRGPVTPTGHTPVYKANGVASFLLHLSLFVFGATGLGLYKLSIVYDELGGILNGLNYFALLFVLVLYIKGIVAPSTRDCGTSVGTHCAASHSPATINILITTFQTLPSAARVMADACGCGGAGKRAV